MGNLANYYKVINLEEGLPTVEQAMKRLTYEVYFAKSINIKVIKFIHGYGSSGKGGKIRLRLRSYLDDLQRKKQISMYVIGEEFSIFNEKTRQVLALCNELRSDLDLERHNNGITVVVL